MLGETLLARNLVPDFLIRTQIRRLLKARLRAEAVADAGAFIKNLSHAPIAVHTREANDQHYEVPARFFQLVLGPNLKYSCALFEPGVEDLGTAEEAMLVQTAARAQLADGKEILELGCGWGSLSLWMASHYPNSRITAVSNSASQKNYIDMMAQQRGLKNLVVITADMNDFAIDKQFDRVVSVEMFEHMRNIPALFKKVSRFLKADGRLFVHIFSHTQFAYLFEEQDDTDWMARYFFTGGMMPSDSLYGQFRDDLQIESQWVVNGTHYSKTAEAWLANMDRSREEIRALFATTYGPQNVDRWWAYWRVFFMSCSELWRYQGGNEWHVMHYRFKRAEIA